MLEARTFSADLAQEPIADLLAREPMSKAPIEANDNPLTFAPRVGERRMFEMPAGVWRAMGACYAIFLLALLGATGGGHAGFAIAISAFYVAMFFGTVRLMLRQAPAQPPSPLRRAPRMLQTVYGPLGSREVYGQMLVVPAAIAFFAIAVLLIRTSLV